MTATVTAIKAFGILLVGLSLIPYGAHLFSLPNKIGMTPDAYLTVVMRGQRTPFRFAVAAAATFLITLAVFVAFTYPANVATDNWTQMPANWSSLRRQWEYSHAVNALLAFAAFSFATLSVVLAKPDTA